MKLEKFDSPMHPEAEHNYSVDFTDLLAAIGDGTDTIVSPGVVTIVSDTPPGFTATFVSLDATLKKVVFEAAVATPDHDDEIYQVEGVEVCIQVNITTSSGELEVQQAILVVWDQCELT